MHQKFDILVFFILIIPQWCPFRQHTIHKTVVEGIFTVFQMPNIFFSEDLLNLLPFYGVLV